MMRFRSRSSVLGRATVLISSALFVGLSRPLVAQGARRAAGAAEVGGGCASPLASPAPRCSRFFPDSLALTAAQKQKIASLRQDFVKAHAAELAQLRLYAQYGQTARQSGQPAPRSGAITAQGDSIRKSLRKPQKRLEKQIESTLTPGQLAWMKASKPARRGSGRRPSPAGASGTYLS